MTAPTSRSESASESAGGEVLVGAGGIGDSTGITVTRLMATAGTIRGATRFTTETLTIEEEASAALQKSCVAGDLVAALLLTAARTGAPSPSTEIPGPPEGMLNPTVRAASTPVPLAAMNMADRKEAFPHAVAPAWVEAEDSMGAVVESLTAGEAESLTEEEAESLMRAAAAGIGKRQFRYVLIDRGI